MGIQEIKKSLTDAINKTNNPLVLLELSKVIDTGIGEDTVIKLSKEQVAEIELAIQQINSGRYLSHEDAKKQSREWLGG